MSSSECIQRDSADITMILSMRKESEDIQFEFSLYGHEGLCNIQKKDFLQKNKSAKIAILEGTKLFFGVNGVLFKCFYFNLLV